jgi:hypothetical protein
MTRLKLLRAAPTEFSDEAQVDTMARSGSGKGKTDAKNKNAAFPKEGGVLFDRDT